MHLNAGTARNPNCALPLQGAQGTKPGKHFHPTTSRSAGNEVTVSHACSTFSPRSEDCQRENMAHHLLARRTRALQPCHTNNIRCQRLQRTAHGTGSKKERISKHSHIFCHTLEKISCTLGTLLTWTTLIVQSSRLFPQNRTMRERSTCSRQGRLFELTSVAPPPRFVQVCYPPGSCAPRRLAHSPVR